MADGPATEILSWGQDPRGQGQKPAGSGKKKQRQKKKSGDMAEGQSPQGSHGQSPRGQQGQSTRGQQDQGHNSQGQQDTEPKGLNRQDQGQKLQVQQCKGQKPLSSGQQGQGQKPEVQQLPGQKSHGQAQPIQSQKPQALAERDGPPQKSKAQLKAERRAIQEAQRAAKAASKSGSGGVGKKPEQLQPPKKLEQSQSAKEVHRVPDHIIMDDDKTAKRVAKKLEKQQIPKRTVVQKKVGLFSHLHQYEREVSLTKDIKFSASKVHPAILKLGLQYAEGVICGSNARCIALLGALKQVISDYKTPPHKELCRDLDSRIKPYISFLTQCRPLSVSMGNAIKHLKWHITHVPNDMTDTEAKSSLFKCIDTFRHEKIELAGDAIAGEYALQKIADGDTIMVYAFSSLIKKVLCHAHDFGKKFRVIVVDGRPKLEGREMLRRLVKYGIRCSYVLISAASYVMKEVTKVFLGAHALLANGYVMSRVGSSQVALIARSYNVPVLVCCETYKFCERVQTDSFVFNELGDPDDLVQTERKQVHLADWRDMKALSLLNLMYDVTPSELISVVITELGMVPCTSVPVVLRVKHVEEYT